MSLRASAEVAAMAWFASINMQHSGASHISNRR